MTVTDTPTPKSDFHVAVCGMFSPSESHIRDLHLDS